MSHKNWFHIVSLSVVFALLLGAWQPVLAQETPDEPAAASSVASEPYVPRDDAPPYGLRGPHPVGVRELVIEPETTDGRPVPVTIWYPALNPDELPEVTEYVLDYGNPNFPDFAVAGRALRDADPDVAGGPYPLVVHSHGLWQFRQASAWLMEQLASHGFVVVAGDHDDNWGDIMGEPAGDNYVVRPQEISRVIDFAATLGAEGEFAGMIDMEHVGVTGHSYGAETALLAGGARLNTDHLLNEWCAANPGDPADPLNDCAGIPPLLDKMATMAGLEEVPTGPWPDWGDPRVDAVVPLFAGPQYFGPEGLAALRVPVLLAESELDLFYGAANAHYHPYTLLPEANKTHVYYENGDHMLFANECGAMPGLVAQGLGWFCWDAVWDTGRAKDLASHFVTAFLLAELKGDAEAAQALAPENVAFPGIQYETTGYDAAPATELDAATVAKIEGIVQQAMADTPTPGMELCIVKDGQVAYSQGFGLADVAGNRPATPQSVLLQASVTKSLTAMAIMRLVEQGLIDLDAQVTTYLPYFTMRDERYKEITVRMLLSHRSGIPDSPAFWQEPLDPAMNPLEQAVRDLSEMELFFAPDEDWSYSAYGYSALGAIIAEVTGKPFESYMQEEWLAPLGMAHATYLAEEVDPALRMTIYNGAQDGEAAPTEPNCDGRDASACNLQASCDDMVKWAQLMLNKGELNGTRFLQPESIDALWASISSTPMVEAIGPWYGAPFAEYGLGWYVGAMEGHRLAGHTGAGNGFNAHLQFAPDDGLAVIAMDNWLDLESATKYPATTAAIDVTYLLLGVEPQEASADAEAPTVQLDSETAATIDTMVEETMARINLPGFALAVVKDGEVAYAKGFGVTSLDGGAPVTSETVFQWAETTMALTAMAVMQLVEEGKIDLDAPVTDYVPYFKLADERYTAITVGQLLAHTSGIPDSGDAMADWENFMPEYDGGALERWVRNDLAAKGLLFAPGAGFEYSDLAYALLGAVIAGASGQPYEAYMQEHILTPLGMKKSTFLLEEVDKTLLASPHVPDAAGEVVVSKALPYHRPFAATNNLFANIVDMAKLALASLNRGALGDQHILPEEAYATMWTATSPTPFADFPFGRVHPSMLMIDWGNGWFLGDVGGHLAPNSYGGEHGFNAHMVLVPDANLAVVAVGNSQGMDEFYAPDMAADVAAMLLEEIKPE